MNVNAKIGITDARRLVSDYSNWRTHAPQASDIVEAIDIQRDHKVAFWDAMIVRSASAMGCDVLVTEDLNSGQTYRGVRASDPFALA